MKNRRTANRFISVIFICVMLISLFPYPTFSSGADKFYQTINIAPYATSKVYMDSAEGVTSIPYAEANVEFPHDYIRWGAYDNCLAISKRHMADIVGDDGILTDNNGVPYSMPLEKGITVRGNSATKTYVPQTTIDLPDKVYENIHFLVVSQEGCAENFHIDIIYADGGIDRALDYVIDSGAQNPENIVCTVSAFAYWGSGSYSLNNTARLRSYNIQPQQGRVVNMIKFYNNFSTYSCKILALTTERKGAQELINELPNATVISTSNYYNIKEQLNFAVREMKEQNIKVSDLNSTALAKLNSVRSALDECLGRYNMFNIAPYATSKVYIDIPIGVSSFPYASANVQYPHDYIKWGSYDNCGAISKREMSSIVDSDGILHDKSGVPYSMPLNMGIEVRADNINSGVNYMPRTLVDVENRVYENLKFIAVTKDTTAENFQINIKYTDGTETSVKAGENELKILASGSSGLDNYIGAVGMFAYWGQGSYNLTSTATLFSYSLKPDPNKIVDKIEFRSFYFNSGFKVLAVSGVRHSLSESLAMANNLIGKLPSLNELSIINYVDVGLIRSLINDLVVRGVTEGELVGYSDFLLKEQKMAQLASQTYQKVEIHVSKTGNDINTGKIAGSAFATIQRARYTANGMKAVLSPNVPIDIVIHGGEYKFDSTLLLHGDKGSENGRITYRAAQGENVVFTGGHTLNTSEFTPVTNTEILSRLPKNSVGKVVQLDLSTQGIAGIQHLVPPESPASIMNLAFYLNGKEQSVSQWPNGEGNYSLSENIINRGEISTNPNAYGGGGIFEADCPNVLHWGNIVSGKSYIGGFLGSRYHYDNVLIDDVDGAQKTISLYSGTRYRLSSSSSKWKVFHLLEELDSPGEWYVDADTMMLYYYPPHDLSEAKLEMALLRTPIISLKNAAYIDFKGITFTQSRSAAISGETDGNYNTDTFFNHDITIEGCTFKNIGTGIDMRTGMYDVIPKYSMEGGYNIIIRDNDFYYIGGRGISFLGGNYRTLQSDNSLISNNYFYRCGQKNRALYAIDLDSLVGTRVENNLIHNLPRTALGYTGNDISIKYNEMYNTLREISDGGIIYSGKSFVKRGNEIAYNYLHDSASLDLDNNQASNTAIYFDDALSGQYAHHNIISNMNSAIFFYGLDNNVHENTIVNSKLLSVCATKGAVDTTSPDLRGPLTEIMTSEYRDMWVNKYPRLVDTYNSSNLMARNRLTNNIYDINPLIHAEISANAESISNNNVYGYKSAADFVNPSAQDYRVKSGRLILLTRPGILNQNNFNINLIGLQASDYRTGASLLSTSSSDFKLLYPRNNDRIDLTHETMFMWEDAVGADKYEIVIATDPQMQNVVLQKKTDYNYILVPELETGHERYYWNVYAINESRQMSGMWLSESSAFSFTLSDINLMPVVYETVDISGYCNAKMVLREGTTDSNPAVGMYNSPYVINQTALEKALGGDKRISLYGVEYKINQLNQTYKAVSTYSQAGADVSIDIPNGYYDSLHFLAQSNSRNLNNYRVTIQYSDGLTQDILLSSDSWNDARLILPCLNHTTGAPNHYEGYIAGYKLTPDRNKIVDRVIFSGTTATSNAISIYALSGAKAQMVNPQNSNEIILSLGISNNSSSAQEFVVIATSKNNPATTKVLALENFSIPPNTKSFDTQLSLPISSADNHIDYYIWKSLSNMTPSIHRKTLQYPFGIIE